MSHWVEHKALWYPGRKRVCGRRLRPLTLGHLRLLEIIESPFLSGGEAGIEDLAAALAICSLPFRAAHWMTGRRWALRIVAFACVVIVRNWEKETWAMQAFISECQWMPEMYREDGVMLNVYGYSSSFAMRLAFLTTKTHGMGLPTISNAVWRMTVPEIMAWRLTDMELNGNEYMTREEAEMTNAAVAAAVEAEASQNEKAVL